MITAIHQPHYFPWMGYFDKIAKSDTFVILDRVQFEKGSQMIRNRVLSDSGDIKYITISADTKNFLEREYRDILVKNPEEWKSKQTNALKNYYRESPFLFEGIKVFEDFIANEYLTLCEWTSESIKYICNLLGINTNIVFQSDIDYAIEGKKSDLLIAICHALGSDCYFSGRGGSVEYLDRQRFKDEGISIVFQEFDCPVYDQHTGCSFVPGLSILDVIFNCGIEDTKNLFWSNRYKTHELDDVD